jgi:glycosyltransferase involved in cell wall biosynthesis
MTEPTAPRISLIICTRNRAQALSKCLEAVQTEVERASALSVEIILVDNGSSDDTRLVIENWVQRCRRSVNTIFEPRAGLSRARNTGLAVAQGSILAFTDDDCRLGEGYFAALAECHAAFMGPVVIGGRIDLGDQDDLPMSIKTDPNVGVFDGRDPGTFLAGCNMTFNRDAWVKLGPIDERLGAGTPLQAGEDTDYVYRAYLMGIPVIYNPAFSVKHFHGRRTEEDARKLQHAYSVGAGALAAKYPRAVFARQFRWNVKNAFAEMFGGLRKLKPKLGLTWWRMAWGNAVGAAKYWRLSQ